MKTLKYLLLLSVLCVMPISQTFAQSTEQQAQAILASGSENTIENLISLGAATPAAAATVIAIVAEDAPRLLGEVLQGLMVVMEPAAFQQAVEAAKAKVSSVALATLITETVQLVASDGYSPGESVNDSRNTDNSDYNEDGTQDETDPSASAA